MDNRVYYGEYCLRHWINLVLKGNITLPDYQRRFVWNERKVSNLIDTFKNKQFVPPVTIGAFKLDGKNENLILDGQQRVTSILLAYLGLFPDAATYKEAIELFASDNDDDDIEDYSQLDNILEWTFKTLTEKGKSKESIISKIHPENYKFIDFDIDDKFLDENFLGFSYLVPQSSDENEQQKYYSSVFRNINIQGEILLPQESRASLYFLDKDLVRLFAPDFCKKITIKLISSEAKSDFVRYLSLLSQYHKDKDESKVARSYKQKMEKYYEEYIYTAISNEESSAFGRFSDVFHNKQYEEGLSDLEDTLDKLGIYGTYDSIVDVDLYLFGLTYQVLFKKKKIDIERKDEIKDDLDKEIKSFKANSSHRKSPNNLKHLRARIVKSISVTGRYTVRETR